MLGRVKKTTHWTGCLRRRSYREATLVTEICALIRCGIRYERILALKKSSPRSRLGNVSRERLQSRKAFLRFAFHRKANSLVSFGQKPEALSKGSPFPIVGTVSPR